VRIALDTNILAYAEGVNGATRKREALELIEAIPQSDIVIPVQVLGELFQVLTRKAGRTPTVARTVILSWRNAYAIIETSPSAFLAAVDLTLDQFSLWDAVILSAAAEADCRILLSEDMQDGFVTKGVTIINPFAKKRHPLLQIFFEEQ
jgi:predicted nucleic acid-binding protein